MNTIPVRSRDIFNNQKKSKQFYSGKEPPRDTRAYPRDVPVNFDALLAALAFAPVNVVEVWRYAITMMVIGDEAARIVSTRQDGEILFITVETDTGERFEVVRPPMSDETEQLLLEEIRKMMRAESADEV